MCTFNEKKVKLQKSILAYKRVARRGTQFVSPVSILYRAKQGDNGTKGTRMTYAVGEIARSPFRTTQGVYLFAHKAAAVRSAIWDGSPVLEVRIPAGTWVYRGTNGTERTIRAPRVKVLREVTK